MEAELINNHSPTGSKLVAAVSKLKTGMSINEILDKTRYITLRRIFNVLNVKEFETPLHIVQKLHSHSLTREDVVTVMTWIINEHQIHSEFMTVLESNNFPEIYKFMESVANETHRRCNSRRWTLTCFSGNS